MRFMEIFENVSPSDIQNIQNKLNSNSWMPEKLMALNGPVIRLDIPKKGHFDQRRNERSSEQDISPEEIETLLFKAKTSDLSPYKEILDKYSKMDDVNTTVKIKDEDGLTIPLAITHNNRAIYTSPESAVAGDKNGRRVPKNIAFAKTIFRKPPIDQSSNTSDI